MKISTINTILITIIALLLLNNQIQISGISSAVAAGVSGGATTTSSPSTVGNKDLGSVDLSSIQGTGYAIAALFPVEDIETAQDAMDMIIPTGTPDYGEAMGVSFDDPVGSLSKLANAQIALLASLTSEQKQRFINLASKPVGISCEYCCGVGPVGIRSDGSSACGCQHNPALLSVAMWLIQNTDYSDAEVVREALKWKALFFPKNMVELTVSLAGGDTSALDALPGMVGGC